MKRPELDATEQEILSFARQWVQLAAAKGFETAVAVLDRNDQVEWSH